MMKPFFLGSLATLTLLSIILMVASEASSKTQERIDNICRSNEDYGFCNNVFHNNLRQPETDYVGLAKITIAEAENNASNTLGFIRAQIPGVKDPAQLDHYKVCQDAYSMLKKRFEEAFDAFNKGDYEEVASDERDTPRVQAQCVTIFSDMSFITVQNDSLNERNREMRILITMAVITATYLVI